MLLLFIGLTTSAAVLFTGIGNGDFSRAGRMEHAAKLTEEERDLLEAFRLNLRVGVKNPGIPPVYTGKLIRDLKETCLFTEVDEIAELPGADVVATIKGGFYDNQEGQHFILHIPEKPRNGVYIRVFYSSSWWGKWSGHKQYMERLTVELLKAAQKLFIEGHLNTSNPIFIQRVNDLGCSN